VVTININDHYFESPLSANNFFNEVIGVFILRRIPEVVVQEIV
jgi:hypothetical protein